MQASSDPEEGDFVEDNAIDYLEVWPFWPSGSLFFTYKNIFAQQHLLEEIGRVMLHATGIGNIKIQQGESSCLEF